MLEVRKIGDRVLKRKSKRVANINDDVRKFCQEMCETMYHNNGIGLAAPQVGTLKRIIVVDRDGEPIVLINPEIIFFSDDKVEMDEGCLSIPEEYKQIQRPEKISVKFRDLDGRAQFNTYDGLISRVIQHEVDHLDGVLMIDR